MLADPPEDFEFLDGVRPDSLDLVHKWQASGRWAVPQRINTGLYWDSTGAFEHHAGSLVTDPFDLYEFSDDIGERLCELRRRVEAGLPLENYGVCDYPEQVGEHWPFLLTSEEKYLITFTEHRRQPGGRGDWRWHKWGRYIGVHEPQYEYLDDEPVIEKVLTFSIYQLTRMED